MNAPDSFCLTNAELWTSEGVQQGYFIEVSRGRLKRMDHGHYSGSEFVIDCNGHTLMPAGIDAQVHLRVPGQSHKETPATGIEAALRGGFSAILTMPNTQPTIDSVEVLERARGETKEFENKYGVKVFWSAAITKKLNSDDLTEFQSLIQAGVKAFTNDGLGVNSDQVMGQAFARLENFDVPLLQHAEFLGHGGSMAPGPAQVQNKATPYPDEPEWKMVERDLRELRKHPKARYHVLHVSSRKTVELIRQAKKEGLKATAEVSPHHLFFNTETIEPGNLSFKMNPPIRTPEDQEVLWAALADGTLDFVATDHAPHEALMKTGEVDKAAFGTTGMEAALRVLLWGVQNKKISEKRLVEAFAERPAEFLRLPPEFGRWKVGEPFHAVLVDTDRGPHTMEENELFSLSKNSCFLGAKLPGRIEAAYHGEKIFSFT